jgi:hypothetical protein
VAVVEFQAPSMRPLPALPPVLARTAPEAVGHARVVAGHGAKAVLVAKMWVEVLRKSLTTLFTLALLMSSWPSVRRRGAAR